MQSKIIDVNNFSDSASTGNVNEYKPDADVQDTQNFEQMLGEEKLQDGSLGSNIMSSFMHVTNNIQYFKNSANVAIKKASLAPDLNNIMQMSTKMHEYSKETSLVSRVLAKASQAVDQLTKLQ